MKTKLVISLLMFTALSALAEGNSFASAGAPKDPYTGKDTGKVSSEVPKELVGVGIEEKIGQNIDLSMMVTNEKGEKVALSSFFKTHKPVIMSPIYFNCPGLCNFHLNGLVDTLKKIEWTPSNQFEIVAFSFDASETAEVALKKKENYLKSYGRSGTDEGWHFVTADQATVTKFTDSVGFKFKWNEDVKEWAHASAAIIVSPEGKIMRYLHGIQFEPRDVKLALNEASNGKVGNIVDQAMLFCFKYDSHQSKYGLQVFALMKIAGAITALALALWLIPVMIRARRENR
ncbi:MAG: SCO family protein [Pseudobdellovibrio sp.]